MAVKKEISIRSEEIKNIAAKIIIAARTAPKTKGIDVIDIAIVDGEDIENLAIKMQEIFERTGREAFKRNADNMVNTQAIVLIGAKVKRNGLSPCSLCGFRDCAENEKHGAICAYNSIDLGIALGSAVSVAADCRVDNRVMWTIGMAAKELKMLDEDTQLIMGIPLSVSGKNAYFDKK